MGHEIQRSLSVKRHCGWKSLTKKKDVAFNMWTFKNENETRRRTWYRELRDILTAERRLEMSRDVVIDELCDTRKRRRSWTMNSEWKEGKLPVNNYLRFVSQLSSHQILRNDVAVKYRKRVGWCEARMLEENVRDRYASRIRQRTRTRPLRIAYTTAYARLQTQSTRHNDSPHRGQKSRGCLDFLSPSLVSWVHPCLCFFCL
jgi:hypothetical protein